ncbi:MAG: hypothetical protein FWC73_03525 [Defluviitaleaceae bacterium]|nr:hypothetical protein [Defluviitaleaceae bacterium]
MKRMLTKSLVLALVLALLAVIAIGCGRNGDEDDTTPDPTVAPAEVDPPDVDLPEPYVPVVEDDWVRPENHITVDIFGRAGIGHIGLLEGWFGQIIYDRFNMTINQISDPGGENQLLWDTRMMARDLGDLVIFSPSDIDDLTELGLILDITDMVETMMPFYTAQFPAGVARTRTLGDGRIFGVATAVSTQTPGSPYTDGHHISRSPFMRQDLYFAIGAPPINTLEDLPGVLAQMRDHAPYTANGNPVYGFQMWGTWCGGDVYLANVLWFNRMYGLYQFGHTGNIDRINQTFEHIFDEDGYYKRALRMLFEANQLGLIDPDSPIQGDDVIWTKAEEGQLLFSWYSWFGMGFNSPENVENAMGMAFIPIMDQTIYAPSIHQDGRGRDLIGIGYNTEDPERLIAFLDWLASPDVFQTIHAGPEGLTWEIVDGEPMVTTFGVEAGVHIQAHIEDVIVPAEWGGGVYHLGGWSNASIILRHRGREINPNTGFTYDPRHWPSAYAVAASPLDTAWQEHFGYAGQYDFLRANNMIVSSAPHGLDFIHRPDIRDTPLGLIHTSAIAVTRPLTWRMIFAEDEAEFDALWAEMIETIMGLGWQDLVDHDMALAEEYFALVNAYHAAN